MGWENHVARYGTASGWPRRLMAALGVPNVRMLLGPPGIKYCIAIILLAATYALVAKGGLTFAIPPGNATAVWPPSGIAVAALVLLGYWTWPGIWFGSVIVNSTTGVSAVTGLLLATGNTLEAVLATWLLHRFLRMKAPFRRARDAFTFTFIAGFASIVAASVGVSTLYANGYIDNANFFPNWVTWWLGDVAGIMILSPLICVVATHRWKTRTRVKWIEFTLLTLAIVAAGLCTFGGILSERLASSLLYFPVVLLAWVALRFGLIETTVSVLLFSAMAICGTCCGVAPDPSSSLHHSLFDLQLFMIVYAMTGLTMGGIVARRRDVENKLRHSRDELEQIVADRTAKLVQANADLENAMAERIRDAQAVRESETLFRTLFDQAPDALVLSDSTGRILNVNHSACDALGYAMETLLDKTVFDITARNNEQTHRSLIAALQVDSPVVMESMFVRRDGAQFPVEVRTDLIQLDGHVRLLSVARDISERRRMETIERLRLDSALDSIGEGILITNRDGDIQYVNPAFQAITGYDRSDLIGKNPRVLQSGEHDLSFYEEMWDTVANGHIWRGAFIDRRKSGQLYDSEVTIAPIQDTDAQRVGYVAVSRDVTARKRAESSQRESEARLRAIVDSASEGIFTADSHGNLESCNPAVSRIFGYSHEDLIGHHLSMLLPLSDWKDARKTLWDWLPVDGTTTEIRGQRKDAAIFPMDLTLREIRLGARRLYTGIVRDATERHARLKAERSLAASDEKLRIARRIQQSFFPNEQPAVPGFDIGGASYPAEETGGDYFDYFRMADGGIGIVVADVSGHGVGPALIMSQTRAYLHAMLPTCSDVAELTTRLNVFLTDDRPDDKFVTFFLCKLDPIDRTFVYASAGHECHVLDAFGRKRSLPATAVPLGMVNRDVPKSDVHPIEPGQLFLFLTDGIAETQSSPGDFFGTQRALDIAWSYRELSARDIVDTLYSAARDFAEGRPQNDDITAVVVKVDRAVSG